MGAESLGLSERNELVATAFINFVGDIETEAFRRRYERTRVGNKHLQLVS